MSCVGFAANELGDWVAGPVIIVPLRGSILQAETCQILRLSENPRWSPSVAKWQFSEQVTRYVVYICTIEYFIVRWKDIIIIINDHSVKIYLWRILRHVTGKIWKLQWKLKVSIIFHEERLPLEERLPQLVMCKKFTIVCTQLHCEMFQFQTYLIIDIHCCLLLRHSITIRRYSN